MLFERGGWYYLLFGTVCCFCEEGSGAEVWAAPHPLGPWQDLQLDINHGGLLVRRPVPAQGWKFMSCSHCPELCHQASWFRIGCTRVNNQSEAKSVS